MASLHVFRLSYLMLLIHTRESFDNTSGYTKGFTFFRYALGDKVSRRIFTIYKKKYRANS